jgi:hypothetical protein
MAARGRKGVGGRPPKFDEPRRPVTVTLPERTLAHLAAIDDDRATAIVKVVDSTRSRATNGKRAVELVEVAPGAAVILVGPSRSLRQIPWLKLAELAPGRYLLTVLPGTPIESLEITILDLLDSLPKAEHYERRILGELRELIGSARRQQDVSKFEMLYVRPSASRRRRAGA